MRRTEDGLIPTALAIAGAVQWVASCGGVWLVRATTRSTVAAGSGGMREGRVLSRGGPSTPSRHTCFCGLLRSRMIDCKRIRSTEITVMEIPLRITENHTKSYLQKLFSDSSVRCYTLVFDKIQ